MTLLFLKGISMPTLVKSCNFTNSVAVIIILFFRILLNEHFVSFTGKYSQPVMTSKLEKNLVELTCVTSGGYPIGAIHWFDGFNTNWTRSAETEHIQMEDKSFTLRSTFTSKDPSHAPYTCVVYNSEWKEEGRVEKNLTGDSGE